MGTDIKANTRLPAYRTETTKIGEKMERLREMDDGYRTPEYIKKIGLDNITAEQLGLMEEGRASIEQRVLDRFAHYYDFDVELFMDGKLSAADFAARVLSDPPEDVVIFVKDTYESKRFGLSVAALLGLYGVEQKKAADPDGWLKLAPNATTVNSIIQGKKAQIMLSMIEGLSHKTKVPLPILKNGSPYECICNAKARAHMPNYADRPAYILPRVMDAYQTSTLPNRFESFEDFWECFGIPEKAEAVMNVQTALPEKIAVSLAHCITSATFTDPNDWYLGKFLSHDPVSNTDAHDMPDGTSEAEDTMIDTKQPGEDEMIETSTPAEESNPAFPTIDTNTSIGEPVDDGDSVNAEDSSVETESVSPEASGTSDDVADETVVPIKIPRVTGKSLRGKTIEGLVVEDRVALNWKIAICRTSVGTRKGIANEMTRLGHLMSEGRLGALETKFNTSFTMKDLDTVASLTGKLTGEQLLSMSVKECINVIYSDAPEEMVKLTEFFVGDISSLNGRNFPDLDRDAFFEFLCRAFGFEPGFVEALQGRVPMAHKYAEAISKVRGHSTRGNYPGSCFKVVDDVEYAEFIEEQGEAEGDAHNTAPTQAPDPVVIVEELVKDTSSFRAHIDAAAAECGMEPMEFLSYLYRFGQTNEAYFDEDMTAFASKLVDGEVGPKAELIALITKSISGLTNEECIKKLFTARDSGQIEVCFPVSA